MVKKLLVLFVTAAMVFTLLAVPAVRANPVDQVVKKVQSLDMFQSKFSGHLVTPKDVDIVKILENDGISLATADQKQAAVEAFQEQFIKNNSEVADPSKLRAYLESERTGVVQADAAAAPLQSLVVPVEFPNTDTDWDKCGVTSTTTGPVHNQIGPPGPRDNNTVWHQDATPALYNELYFAYGPNAGITINHPNLGAVSFKGYTMANYFLEQSHGTFLPVGLVYPKWLQAAHSEAWYGYNCGGSRYVRARDLVRETVDLVNADNPNFNWEYYDADGDGYVDNYTVVHAGMGEEGGGGAQGTDAIWSHAWGTFKLACTAPSTGCPNRDIYVGGYSMDPENLEVGVIAEEYGHQIFGLPDLYTTDAQASMSNWAIMESGSWNGKLAGMQPAPFPLLFRYWLGWANPAEMDYDDEPAQFKVAQLSGEMVNGAEDGIRINLPDRMVTVPSPLNTGNAWWSTVDDLVDYTLTRAFDLANTTSPIFSFDSDWDYEVDYDYGWFKVSTDGGTSWTILPDMDGKCTTSDPNGQNPGCGFNGSGQFRLRFDLTPYAGQNILVQLHSFTDPNTHGAGWFADNFSLVDGAATLWSDDVETLPSTWTADGWMLVPFQQAYPRYYLAEWRNNSGFDRGLAYPYQTVYSDADEWEVDRAPHTVPGMLLYFRDTWYAFDYTLLNAEWDSPSMGPKHGLLVIDSHPWPYEFENYKYSSGAHIRMSVRVQPADATFTLRPTTKFKIRLGYDPATGIYQPVPLETKTAGPRPAVSQFHDSLGYYPGLWYRPATGGIYYWQRDASAVVPAMDDYTIKITDLNKNPFTALYGATVNGFELGTGNPGDSGVQFGLHIAVVGQAKAGSWGLIQVWNSPQVFELTKTVDKAVAVPGDTLHYVLTVKNTTPIWQTFTLTDPIPANTTFLQGWYYNAKKNQIRMEMVPIEANGTREFEFWVTVNANTPSGTTITNTAYMTDVPLGKTASATTSIP
jgi:immune inhibitor A